MADGTVQTIEIAAPPEAVFAVAADVTAYTEWADGVRDVEILESDADDRPRRARFVVDGMVKELTYVLVYEYDEPNLISWTAEPNDDLKQLVGSYEFTEMEDGGSSVVYALRAEIAFKIPGFLRRQVEKQIVGTALRGLRKRVEALRDA